MKSATRIMWTALALVALAGCGSSTDSDQASASPRTATAKVESLAMQQVARQFEAVGTVESRLSAGIQSKVVANVRAVHVEPGAVVRADDVLVELDDRELQANLSVALNTLREAESALEQARTGTAAAKANVAAADAERDLAQTTLVRYQNLLSKKAVSRQQHDEAQAAATARAAMAQSAAELWQSSVSGQMRAEAAVKRAQAAVDAATTALSYATLRAPFDGIVTMKQVDAGDLASPGRVLLMVEDPNMLRVSADVRESDAALLKIGDAATVRIDALDGLQTEARISEIVPASDPASRTVEIRINLPQQERMRTGMFARALFATGATTALTVPATALRTQGQLTTVIAVGDGDTAQVRLVKTGRRFGDRVEVLAGVDAGERIVVESADAIADGTRLRIG